MTYGDKVEINNFINFEKILKEKGKLNELEFHNNLADIFKKVVNENYEATYIVDADISFGDVRSYEQPIFCALSVNYSEYVTVSFTHNLSHAKIYNFREFMSEYLSDLIK